MRIKKGMSRMNRWKKTNCNELSFSLITHKPDSTYNKCIRDDI